MSIISFKSVIFADGQEMLVDGGTVHRHEETLQLDACSKLLMHEFKRQTWYFLFNSFVFNTTFTGVRVVLKSNSPQGL